MNIINYFKDLFESKPDYRKIVLLVFLIKNDADLLRECGFLNSDSNILNLEFENIWMEQNEDYLDYIKNEEESNIDIILNKEMGNDLIHFMFRVDNSRITKGKMIIIILIYS